MDELKAAKLELAHQKIRTELARERANEAQAEAEMIASRRSPALRTFITGLGAFITSLGIGDSLRPDDANLIAQASNVEIAVFHNEADALKLIVLGTGLVGGAQIRRRKRKGTRS